MSDLEITVKVKGGTWVEISSEDRLDTELATDLMAVMLRTVMGSLWPRQYAIHCGAEHELDYYGGDQ
jgi:hypothetical protein